MSNSNLSNQKNLISNVKNILRNNLNNPTQQRNWKLNKVKLEQVAEIYEEQIQDLQKNVNAKKRYFSEKERDLLLTKLRKLSVLNKLNLSDYLAHVIYSEGNKKESYLMESGNISNQLLKAEIKVLDLIGSELALINKLITKIESLNA